MPYSILLIAALGIGQTLPPHPQPFSLGGERGAVGAGDHKRTITVDGQKRQHWIHVPPKYDPRQPASVVLALHGATMTAKAMEMFTDLNSAADAHNFVVVYPNGTGFLPTWNAGLFPGELSKSHPDDIKYLHKVLDDVIGVVNVNKKRVYATGMSNGGMMCYRVANEMSDRIAAIAPVAGTIALEKYEPKRPVPVLHFHGTKDSLVPFEGPAKKKETKAMLKFLSVDDTMRACVKSNGCAETPIESVVDAKEENLKVIRKEYPKGKAPVILYVIENAGHVWPGRPGPAFLGQSTRYFAANDLIWAFFRQHELK